MKMYFSVGNSVSKKDAQTNAARDFLQFLIRNGDIKPGEISDQVHNTCLRKIGI